MNEGRVALALDAFAQTLRVPNLRRAQLSFGAAWTAEWAVTVVVGILAFQNGGDTAVGIVGLARMLPAALLAPSAAVVVDRFRRERVLACIGLIRTASLAGAAFALGSLSSPVLAYILVAIETVAYTLYRPAHSALLPSICTTATELTSANVVRGLLDSSSALVGPLLAAALVEPLGIDGVLAVCAAMALWSAVPDPPGALRGGAAARRAHPQPSGARNDRGGRVRRTQPRRAAADGAREPCRRSHAAASPSSRSWSR